jgi:hypothetical protein
LIIGFSAISYNIPIPVLHSIASSYSIGDGNDFSGLCRHTTSVENNGGMTNIGYK